jgi:hypothetical protein
MRMSTCTHTKQLPWTESHFSKAKCTLALPKSALPLKMLQGKSPASQNILPPAPVRQELLPVCFVLIVAEEIPSFYPFGPGLLPSHPELCPAASPPVNYYSRLSAKMEGSQVGGQPGRTTLPFIPAREIHEDNSGAPGEGSSSGR